MKMKKIAITQRIIDNDTYAETRDALDVRWAGIFERLNYLPIIIPSNFDNIKFFKELEIDGIILSGGNDLSVFSQDKNSLKRDEQEKSLLNYAIKNKIPVLGICRGMQLMAEHFGGKLKKTNGHVGNKHKITACKDSWFYKDIKNVTEVNSYHNYAVTVVPPGFKPSAKSADGTFEAMECPEKKLFAIMWHPERNKPLEKSNINLIQHFFDA